MRAMPADLFVSPRAAARVSRATAWLGAQGAGRAALVVGATYEAASDLCRAAAAAGGASFGWHRATLGQLAGRLALGALAERSLAAVGPLALEALCARVTARLAARGALGRLQVVADRPGLPRALARTLRELRLAGHRPGGACATVAPELDAVHAEYEAELARAGLADRALVLALATEAARAPDARHELLGAPLCLLDVPLAGRLERDLVAALAARAPAALATLPAGDERSIALAREALAAPAPGPADPAPAATSLERLQRGLFAEGAVDAAPLDGDVLLLSAPGESRECVEIARHARRFAETRGVPFDRMAILLRAPEPYRAHVDEALRRAGIPAHFARGTVRPDPAGRALLALLACAAEGLSARGFAEYLSLGEVPEPTAEGAPPPAAPPDARWVPADEELAPLRAEPAQSDDDDDDEAVLPADPNAVPAVAGTLRAPRHWERLIVDAAVIGGRARWERRLDGLANELRLDLAALDPDDAGRARVGRDLASIASLRAYALPLLDALAALPQRAAWGDWVRALSALATRALRRPARVLAVLAELMPMSDVGPVDLAEVRLVLGERLGELVERPSERRFGRMFVGPIDAARGLAFDVVFVPGLAEKLFPPKVVEDPILPDAARAALDAGLDTRAERIAAERLALRLAVGAATEAVVLSYPRVDMDQSRPRVPSFYVLDAVRAAEGRLLGYEELARRADRSGETRLGWPAPREPADAIDEAEHDLALLGELVRLGTGPDTKGRARYLLTVNDHLSRALRFRARRWTIARFSHADGLVLDERSLPAAKAALAAHALSARSYSPTALQHFAACPYRFVLQAIHKLSPREEPEPIEEMDALQRGSLVHAILYAFLVELRAKGLLPVGPERLDAARALLDEVATRVAGEHRELYAPAIDRVWDDSIAGIEADLREWLRRVSEEREWTPWKFELSFGLADRRDEDPDSVDAPVRLDCGIALRGSIDLVERSGRGAVRATDYKTGKVRAEDGDVVGGGETLQPVLYALTLEKLLPGTRVEAGRLYYCTTTGGFESVVIPLDDKARQSAAAVASTIGDALDRGFLPAAPAKDGCAWCDYKVVCGPFEESRLKKKNKKPLEKLEALRKLS
jgi:RecB family exonuclease